MQSVLIVSVSWVFALFGFWLVSHFVPIETLRPYIDITNLFAVIAAAIIAYGQLWLLNEQLRREHLKNRRDHALSYSLPKSKHVLEALQLIDEKYPPSKWRDEPIDLEKIIDPETGEAALADTPKNEIELLLAHWENLALTIGAGTTDEAVAFEMAGELLVAYLRRFENFIAWYRKRNPRAYEHLCNLAKRWTKQLSQEKHTNQNRRFLPSSLLPLGKE